MTRETTGGSGGMALLQRWIARAVPATPQERAAALWSFGYFFTLLAGYCVLRPLRDQMGIAGGVKALPWMFTATFVTLLVAQPLYGALVVHGRSLHQRAGQAPVRIHRRRGDGRFVGGSSGHDRPFGIARPDQPADRGNRLSRTSGVVRSPALSVAEMRGNLRVARAAH